MIRQMLLFQTQEKSLSNYLRVNYWYKFSKAKSTNFKFRQDLQIKLLRGNIDTRLKTKEKYDGIIFSAAGLNRMTDHVITEVMDHKEFLPAACQGAVGVQSEKVMV